MVQCQDGFMDAKPRKTLFTARCNIQNPFKHEHTYRRCILRAGVCTHIHVGVQINGEYYIRLHTCGVASTRPCGIYSKSK